MGSSDKRLVGIEVSHPVALATELEELLDANYAYVVCPLKYNDATSSSATKGLDFAFTRDDVLLQGSVWSPHVVGVISNGLECADTTAADFKAAAKTIEAELSWASHLGLTAVVVPPLNDATQTLATLLLNFLNQHSPTQVLVRTPLMDGTDDADVTWKRWNRLRHMCDSNKKLAVCLEVGSDLPASDGAVQRWCAEPVKCVVISTDAFISNKAGYPVLPQRHQRCLTHLLEFKDIQVAVRHPSPEDVDGRATLRYKQYLENFLNKIDDKSELGELAGGYEDFLQSPLQPLMDNLESQIYETFEKDPVKYVQYEEAVYRALLDRVPDEAADAKPQVVMVVGAGRGPLVRCALRAGKRASRKIRVFAIEKNPNAVLMLNSIKALEWGDDVTVVATDMRVWETAERADIMVSELLGSFGDNELSPECLDGAQAFLKEDGVSIPSKYTSYATPVSSSKLYQEVRAINTTVGWETPYVVWMQKKFFMAEAAKVFEYEHPNKGADIDNDRYRMLKFQSNESAMMHGVAGFFDSVLYKDVMISIHPDPARFSTGMFSWFPIFFPLMSPIYVEAGTEVQVHFWRKANAQKVWYEWLVATPTISSPICNPGGRSYSIGL